MRNIPEERKSHIHRGGRPKSRIQTRCWVDASVRLDAAEHRNLCASRDSNPDDAVSTSRGITPPVPNLGEWLISITLGDGERRYTSTMGGRRAKSLAPTEIRTPHCPPRSLAAIPTTITCSRLPYCRHCNDLEIASRDFRGPRLTHDCDNTRPVWDVVNWSVTLNETNL
jgi:hypothetical protein